MSIFNHPIVKLALPPAKDILREARKLEVLFELDVENNTPVSEWVIMLEKLLPSIGVTFHVSQRFGLTELAVSRLRSTDYAILVYICLAEQLMQQFKDSDVYLSCSMEININIDHIILFDEFSLKQYEDEFRYDQWFSEYISCLSDAIISEGYSQQEAYRIANELCSALHFGITGRWNTVTPYQAKDESLACWQAE